MPWDAIKYVGSGLTLAAFVAAVIAWVIKSKLEERGRLIKGAKEDDRASLVRDALEFFHVDTSDLTKAQQYQLALEQIRARGQRFKIIAVIVCVIAALGALVAVYAIARPATGPKNRLPANAEEAALYNEAQFRMKQVDEALQTAVSQGKQCLERQRTGGSVLGADIRDYLTSAQVVRVTVELGGIYRNPGQEDDTVWISSSGYGLRHLPEKSGQKDSAFKERDLCDIARDYSNLQNQKSDMTCPTEVSQALDDLKEKAKFTQTAILEDWFKRHQAQGVYKAKYGDAYKVYEIQVDDYGDELTTIDRWVNEVQKSWDKLKQLKAMTSFSIQ